MKSYFKIISYIIYLLNNSFLISVSEKLLELNMQIKMKNRNHI